MINTERKGFTLIEILIVVAIIAILASIVLVGLGPTQESGRDARRLSDLHEVQTGLELFYNKCGFYPGTDANAVNPCIAAAPGGTWSGAAGLNADLLASGVLSQPIPNDPSGNRTYAYYVDPSYASYVLGTALENPANAALVGYTPPVNMGGAWSSEDNVTVSPAVACTGAPVGGAGGATYCLTL